MKLSYRDITGDGQRHTVQATVTTDHAASSYGQPVVVLPDGDTLDASSWALCDYRIEEITAEEYDQMLRSNLRFGWPERPPSKIGRPRSTREKRTSVMLTLPASEVERLRELGNGSASAAVSMLLKQHDEKD